VAEISEYPSIQERNMTDRAFLKTFSGLLAALVALTVIIFVVAQMVSGSTKTKTAQNDAQLAERIKPVGELALAGASAVANSVIPSASAAGDKGESVYKATCSVCHAAGVAGAPKFGDKADWGPRIAQGADTLHTHALKGFTGKKGMMPAKGGNMGLSDADVKAAVDYMMSKGK
jgi:cytochrome c5